MNVYQCRLRKSRASLAEAKAALRTANRIKSPWLKAKAFAYINKARSQLKRAIKDTEAALERTKCRHTDLYNTITNIGWAVGEFEPSPKIDYNYLNYK